MISLCLLIAPLLLLLCHVIVALVEGEAAE